METDYEFIAARLKSLERDSDWRHRWHNRLGRGVRETEGRFYERLEAILLEYQEAKNNESDGKQSWKLA